MTFKWGNICQLSAAETRDPY